MGTDTIARMVIDTAALSDVDRPVYEWLRDHFGCEPQNFCRQLRWRISWEADVVINGRLQGVLVRGARGKSARYPMTLHQEAQVHHVMERHGVLAPKVYGMIEDPIAIVMERLDGTINSALIEAPVARNKVRREFINALAKLHAIPVEEFGAIGLPVPKSAREIALSLYKPCIDIVRAAFADRPFPLTEFYARWLEKNAPEDRDRPGFVTADAGQFLYDGDRFTGLIDFEVSYIGDPAAEFAGMRLRDTTEPLGDISELRKYYESLTGDRIPYRAIAYHSAGFASTNSMLMWPMMYEPEVQNDYVAYLQFCVATSRWGLQGIAESLGVTLDPVADPLPNPTVPYEAAPSQLINMMTSWETGDTALRFHLDSAAVLGTYLQRCAIYGGSILAADLADAEALTGKPVTTRLEADAAVDAFVRSAGSDQDATLVAHFNRWLSRQNFLLKGCGSQSYLTATTLQPIRE